MKKIFFATCILLVFLSFYACGAEDETMAQVDKLNFFVVDASSDSELSIIPDEEIGTLDVYFVQDFTENEEIYETEGIVGGDYYEDYKKVVEIGQKYEMLAKNPESAIYLEFIIEDEKMFLDVDNFMSEEDKKFISNYYKEVVELFTEDLL
ncbi:hypothetical protein GF354_00700 [Candidatus Peregrinibacteria bacterium]|nr:hypothetical protein [Candidatus Peregrinibacteria bacterium]